MTLALNPLRQLSGSKIILLALLAMFWMGCKTSKKTPRNTPRPNVTKKEDNKVIKPSVDTISWNENSKPKNPPVTNETTPSNKTNIGEVKSEYSVAMFLPYKNGRLDLDNKYVQYYAGMKLACKELEQNGVLINIQLKDSERVQQLENYEKYDLVIAPNDKQIVNNLIEYGKENETLVISPWYTNSTATVENPYYLQLTPNVKEHFNKIIEHASLSFEPNEIALVGLNTPKYVKWFNYFQATYRAFTQNQSPLVEHFVLQDSLALGEWVFGEQIKNGVKAFILPNYSSRDENHVYSVLRRLNAEKGLDQITVYGMPLLINSDRIGYDYYSNLNMRIAISEHIDFSSNDASAFRSRYFNEYKDLASIDAIEGYDMINFLGDVLSQYGSGFCSSVNDIKMDYLHHSLNIQPVYSEDDLELQKVNFFENKHLEIIEFTDGKFRKSN